MLIKLDLTDVPPEVQYEFWQSVTPTAYGVGRVPNGNGLNAVASFWSLDRILASHYAAGAHRITRGDKAAGRSRKPFVKVRLYHSGSAQFHDNSGVRRLLTGDVHIIDQSRAWTAIYERHDQYSIFIPHELIGYDPSEHPTVRTFRLRSHEGRLLNYAIRGFYEALADGRHDTTEITAVVEAALHGGVLATRDPQFRAARNKAMRLFARNTHLDSRLKVETLATGFGVSRATVFRVFEDHGGLEHYRRHARLDRAYDLLAGREAHRGEIGQIATRLGFSSTAHFSDAFLERFGRRPSQAAGLPCNPVSQGVAPLNDLRDLEATVRHTRSFYAGMTG